MRGFKWWCFPLTKEDNIERRRRKRHIVIRKVHLALPLFPLGVILMACQIAIFAGSWGTQDERDEVRPKWDKGGCEPRPPRVGVKSHDKQGAFSEIDSGGRQVCVPGDVSQNLPIIERRVTGWSDFDWFFLYVSFGVCLSFLVTDPDVCDFGCSFVLSCFRLPCQGATSHLFS